MLEYFQYKTVQVQTEKSTYQVDVELTIEKDPAYGADCDGTRGSMRETVTDVRIIDIFDLEQDGQDVTAELQGDPEIRSLVEREL